MASLLDPFGLWRRTFDTLEVGARVGIRVAAWAGSQLAESLNGTPSKQPLALESSRRPEPVSSPEPLRDKMQRLESRALEQTTRGSQTELFHRILDQIVPDEARIIGAPPTDPSRRWSTSADGAAPASWRTRRSSGAPPTSLSR